MLSLSLSPPSSRSLLHHPQRYLLSKDNRRPNPFYIQKIALSSLKWYCLSDSEAPDVSNVDHPSSIVDDDGLDVLASSIDPYGGSISGDKDGIAIVEIEKTGKNSRRIRSQIDVNATLETVWSLLTDYERLADFIPGLLVSQLIEKSEKFAKLFQIGEQNLAFGLKFNAKGIVDCYENDLEVLPRGRRRVIDFKMVEGDFQTFEGKWIIEQMDGDENDQLPGEEKARTLLSYVVDVEPKLWLPVGLVEGRLSREIKQNLVCIKNAAHQSVLETLN